MNEITINPSLRNALNKLGTITFKFLVFFINIYKKQNKY